MVTRTLGEIAALNLDDPRARAWLEQYAVDHLVYNALEQERHGTDGMGAASFRDGKTIIWQPVMHERYAVIGRVETGEAYYAIPHNAQLTRAADSSLP